jgi:hypothetical protein
MLMTWRKAGVGKRGVCMRMVVLGRAGPHSAGQVGWFG